MKFKGENEMDPKYAPLFTPIKIGNCEIKNRVVIPSMGGTSMIDWNFGCKFRDDLREYYLERARNDVGLIIPGITMLRSLKGGKWLYKHPEMFPPVGALVDEMHTYGAKVFTQLTAGMGRSLQIGSLLAPIAKNKLLGFILKPYMNMDKLLVGVDEGAPNVWMPEIKHRALSAEEIQEYVYAYAQTALLCKNAGVDGVEVHAVHEGYLLDQFTLKYCNHRTDAYGGSFENRYRFPVEVVKAIKDACGVDYPVSLRYSVVSKTKGYNSGAVPGEVFEEAGRDMDESERAIQYLREAGYDSFNADNGTYDAW
jgi:2-enoate reductase